MQAVRSFTPDLPAEKMMEPYCPVMSVNPVTPAEEEKELALFFLDIRNFTPFVETHVAMDVVRMIRKLFFTFEHIIRTHHGRIIETSGDGLYAVFGFDTNVREATNAAMEAGFSILENLDALNETFFREHFGQKIEVGIGLHVGKVVTGNISLGSEDHLIVMGYPVNIAARIEAATKELNNNFIVSSDVFQLLKNPPSGKETANVTLKGVTGTRQLHLIGRAYAA